MKTLLRMVFTMAVLLFAGCKAVKNVLRHKFRAGLLENNGILPLKEPAKIFVTGPNTNSMWAMCGDYYFSEVSIN